MVTSDACSSFFWSTTTRYVPTSSDDVLRRSCFLNARSRVTYAPHNLHLYQGKFEKFCQCAPQRSPAIVSKLEQREKSFSNDGRTRGQTTIEHGYASKPEADYTVKTTLSEQLNAFYRFSRPHTVIGTIVGITSVSLLPLQTVADLNLTFILGILKALLPAILMNIYVVGLNQLYDVEIDKVNKPDLPLASGDFSMELGTAIVASFSLLSFAMGLVFKSPPLIYALVISFVLGSAYSIDLPYLRWKKHAFLAATCILSVRALVVQLSFFLHIQKYVLGKPIVFTRSLVFATAFMCFFSAVIALFKDIPDLDGDRNFGIQSLTVQLGQKTVFWLCITMLLIAYGTAIVIGASSTCIFSKFVTVFGHCMLATVLWLRARSIDVKNKESVTSFYMFIWNLFYAEYFLIPFVR